MAQKAASLARFREGQTIGPKGKRGPERRYGGRVRINESSLIGDVSERREGPIPFSRES